MLGTFLRKGGWIGLLLIAVALVPLWVWRASGADARTLAKDGVAVTAQVVSLENLVIATPGAGGARRENENHTATVRFAPPGGGADLTEARPVTPAFYDTLREGQDLTIRVLPDDPSVIEVEPGFVAGNAAAAGWVGLGLMVLGGVAAALSLRSARRAVRLDVAGVETTATVVRREPAAKGVVVLTLAFRSEGSGEQQARVILRKAQSGATLDVGNTACLRYDPADPANARLI